MAGIPGLRDVWGAIGDGLDWIGDTAEDALTFIASPFVDEEGELFGFISKDDLVTSYKKQREGQKTSRQPTGSKQYVQQGIEALNTQAVSEARSSAVEQLRNQEPYAAYNQQVNSIESLPKIVDQILKAGKFESKTLTPEQKLTMGPNILLKDNQLNVGPTDKIDLSAYRRSVKNQQRRNRED
tara:strand:+ start:537 stop:1085 length:549 start_codon:yes stop_codon:yes gene_type:complete